MANVSLFFVNSILCVQSVKSHFTVIAIMKGRAWLIVRLTTMRYGKALCAKGAYSEKLWSKCHCYWFTATAVRAFSMGKLHQV